MRNTSETSLRDVLTERLLAVVGVEDTAEAVDPEYRAEAGQVSDELLPAFAVELLRLADEFDGMRQDARDSGNPNRSAALFDCAARLRARADKLDGGAR